MHQLAYHIAGFYPKHLIVIDPSEHALAALKIKLDQLYPDVVCDYVLASITDHATMDRLVEIHHPQIIIHGDRMTHPDLIARNLLMAVQKNILSPLHLAQGIKKTEARLFILVNAQAPTRLTSIITRLVSQKFQDMDQATTKKNPTRFLVINSADVWNNLDSATAFWSEQLTEGLEITLPSPDAYSYLLSAQEAARTILQALVKALSTEKTRGQVLHLSGGEPSRFLELIRSLSLLHGFIPEVDVKIKFSGNSIPVLTPSCETDDLLESLTPGMTMGTTNSLTHTQDDGLLIKLTGFLEKGQTAKIVSLLEEIGRDEENIDARPLLKLAG
ncbi:MAG: hypothetical protein K0R52_1297 [Alphaproteobacteria bacterium]|nr:hypothetical protein [Alphaproteobacteria bacterium]